MKPIRDEKLVYLLMILTALFWAGAFIGGKIGVKEFPPFSLTFFRFLFATIILFPIMIKYEPISWKIKKQDLPVMIILGTTGMFGYHALFFGSLMYTTAINTSLISATSPVITTVLATLMVGEILGWKRAGAVLLAFFGVLLTITNGDWYVVNKVAFNFGDLLMVTASLCKAIYIVMSRKVGARFSPIVLTTYSFLVCVLVSIPFVIMEKPAVYLPKVSWESWLAVTYMAVFASGAGYLLQQIAIKSIGASKTTAFENIVPIFVIVLSTMILHESVNAVKIFAAAIIIAGVYWNSTISSNKKVTTGKSVLK